MILDKNRTTNEYAGSTAQRANADGRLQAKLDNNQAIANAHRLPAGPSVTASQEPQPAHQRPVINLPG